jgi:hypothetical protein
MQIRNLGKTHISFFQAISVTVVFFLASMVIAFNHELWLDEASTLLTVKNTHGLHGFYQVFRYDGNPWLWFALLKIVTIFNDHPFTIQIFHICIATSAVYMIFRYSPFIFIEKVLIISGYFFIYEYNIISRNYALGLALLLGGLYCIQNKKYITALIVLVCCMQTHLHFSLLAFTLIVCTYFPLIRKQLIVKNILFIGIVVLGCLLLFFQVMDAGSHGYFQYQHYKPFSGESIQRGLIMPLRAIFPISDPISFTRDSNVLLQLPHLVIALIALLSVGFPFIILRTSKRASVFFLLILSGIIFLSFISRQPAIQLRHCGTIWIGFIVARWLQLNDATARQQSKRNSNRLFLFLLCIQIYPATVAVIADLQRPFSEGRSVAAYIMKNHLEDHLIICGHHFHGPPIAVYLDQPLYYPERKEMGTYCIWNTQPFMITDADLSIQVDSLLKHSGKEIVLILNDPDRHAKLQGNFQLNETAVFNHSIVRSENFYVYEVVNKKP